MIVKLRIKKTIMTDNTKKQLKGAIHYSIGKQSEDAHRETGKEFSKGFMALLSEATTDTMELFAQDLEAFAKHGKRTIINVDDVKLLCRRNPTIFEKLDKFIKENALDKQWNQKGKQRKRKSEILLDDDND
uniref:Centromere protein S n=1 Tax=Clytia hemisphaerica TaxID=252671 RepID=A0A7M5WR21_9CNID